MLERSLFEASRYVAIGRLDAYDYRALVD